MTEPVLTMTSSIEPDVAARIQQHLDALGPADWRRPIVAERGDMASTSEVDTLDCASPDLNVILSYPRSRPTKGVCINLSDVRAAPGIRVSYDFERDGWVVERPVNGPEEGERWMEYGFFTAWNLEP